MIEEVRSHSCNEDCDQVDDEVVDQLLCSFVKDIDHLECEDIEDMYINS